MGAGQFISPSINAIKYVKSWNNLIPNPLCTSTIGWYCTKGTIAATNGEIVMTNDGTSNTPRVEARNLEALTIGDVYKIRFKIRDIDGSIQSFTYSIFGLEGGTAQVSTIVNTPTQGIDNEWEYKFTVTDQTGQLWIHIKANYADADTANGKTWAVHSAEVINLTKNFGASSIPEIGLHTFLTDAKGGVFAGLGTFEYYYDRLYGSKIACFGDSLTEGDSNTNIPDILAALTGATVYNCGVGGTRLTGGATNYDKFSMVALANAYATATWTDQDTANETLTLANYNTISTLDLNDVQYVTIWFGTNDFVGGTVIGTSSDDETYFVGAIYHIIDTLLTAFPHLKIMFITPMWRQRQIEGDGKESDANALSGVYLIDYANAMETSCNLNHIPVLNLHENGGITKYNYLKYLQDGLHLNGKGRAMIAYKIYKFLDTFV